MLDTYQRTLFTLLVAGVVVATAAGPARSVPCPTIPCSLDFLTDTDTAAIQVDDKVFSHFLLTNLNPLVNPKDISVEGISKPGVGLEHGLRFTLSKPDISVTGPPLEQFQTNSLNLFSVRYQAQVLGGSAVISGWTLAVEGSDSISVSEAVTGPGVNDFRGLDRRVGGSGPVHDAGSPSLVDFPAALLSIQTIADVELIGHGLNVPSTGMGTLNSIDETLSQVPEPTTLLLFGTTAAGLGLARWRQRKRGQSDA